MNANDLYQQMVQGDGSTQLRRMLPALDPASAPVDDRTLRELLSQAYQLAQTTRLFDKAGRSAGDWRPFFGDLVQNPLTGEMLPDAAIASALEQKTDFAPQFALFLTFLALHARVREGINAFSQKHLDHYFREILQQQPQGPKPDTAHLVFDLTKSAAQQLLPAGTLLAGGKDPDGNTLLYQTNRETVLSQAKVTAAHSVFVEKKLGLGSKIWSSQVSDLEKKQAAPSAGSEGTWSLFGAPQSNVIAAERTMQEGRVGFAIGSFMFLLAEGERTIELTLTSAPALPGTFGNFDLTADLSARLSGEKGWLEVELQQATLKAATILSPASHYAELYLKIHLPAAQPAVTGYSESILQANLSTSLPVLEIVLRPQSWRYETLRDFRVQSGKVAVEVKGAKTFAARNDDTEAAPRKPFQPFGAAPFAGSHCYIASREIFLKRLTKLSFRLLWQNPPVKFSEHYRGWSSTSINPSNFRTDLELLVNGQWQPLLDDPISLFDPDVNNKTLTDKYLQVQADELNAAFAQGDPLRNNVPNTDSELFSGDDGQLRFVLTQDLNMPFEAFGHRDFPTVMAQKAVLLAKDPVNTILPLPPYTPTLREINFDYKAEEDLFAASGAAVLFHLHPFGVAVTLGKGAALAPDMPLSGHLYLGITGFAPPASINLFFALREGDAVLPDFVAAPDAQSGMTWSYLADNVWQPLSAELVTLDTTATLQRPGLISFTVPTDSLGDNSLLPKGLLWLRGVTDKDFGKTSRAAAVYAQAIDATLLPDESGGYARFDQHLSVGLPANTITKLLKPLPSVKTVRQPLASTGGSASEAPLPYYARVGERLRHKNRAVSPWDFERLTLERFPEVFKAKSIPAGTTEGWQPGQTDLVVVAAHGNGNLEPKASGYLLEQIRQFLASGSASTARIAVRNPVYERIFLDFKVRFLSGLDPGYYSKVLQAELVRYLTPWAFAATADVHFGAKVRRAEMMFFVETRPYVEVLTDFRMYHLNDTRVKHSDIVGKMTIGTDFVIQKPRKPTIGGMTIGQNFIIGEDVEVAEATTPASILVSSPQHRIQILSGSEVCIGISDYGIGSMTIGLDFGVSAN